MSKFGWSYPAGCSGPPDEDVQDVCPVCGLDNADPETGNWVYEQGPFCSQACEQAYMEQQRVEAEMEAKQLEDCKDLDMEYIGPEQDAYEAGNRLDNDGHPDDPELTEEQQAFLLKAWKEDDGTA